MKMKNIKNKIASIEMDQVGYIILGLVLLLVLIYIVTVVLGGEIDDQGEKVSGIFRLFD